MTSKLYARSRALFWVVTMVAQVTHAQGTPQASSPTANPSQDAQSGAPFTRAADGWPIPPDRRVLLNHLVVFRLNPLGLESQTRAGLQLRLYDSESPIARDNFLFFGLTPRINPAYIKFGQSIELQPLSIINLKATAEVLEYFGTFGFFQSFQSPNDNYSDTTLLANREAGTNYSTTGFHFAFEPLLQLKVGKVAVRNKTGLEYWAMSVHRGDPVWYDATLDTLVPANGWVLTNDLDVLYVTGGPWTVGLRYSLVKPYYKDTDVRAGEALPKSNDHGRVGPLVAYTFYDEGFSTFNRPSVLLIMNWYTHHRWRTGADGPRWKPYLVLGFASASDFGL